MDLGMGWTRYDPDKLSLGVFFVGLAALTAVLVFPGAKESASAVLYILIFGGLSVGVPGALGVGIIIQQLRFRKSQRTGHETSD
jgi:hypothetical protein